MLAIEILSDRVSHVIFSMLISWNSGRQMTMLATEILLDLCSYLSIQYASIMEFK